MRILRLWAPSLIGDHTLCYVHTNRAGKTCINDVEIPVTYARAGVPLGSEKYKAAMTIVLPQCAALRDGDFLAAGDCGDTLLRWNERSQSFKVCLAGFLGVSERAEILHPVRTAVLTVSDETDCEASVNTTGPEIERLAFMRGFVTEERKTVPSDIEQIRTAVQECAGHGINLVITAGGTGLTPRDVTPEALVSIADKVIPGFGEAMRSEAMRHSPMSFLTRTVTIVTGQTLVISLPGNTSCASRCFEAVAGAVRHALTAITGTTMGA